MICSWQVENDEFCNKVLEKHWPDVPQYGDIRECTGLVADDSGDRWRKGRSGGLDSIREGEPERALLAPVDLICGGFPCQPFSQAGKRLGTEDDRDLWPQMARLIEELRPAWVLGENVAGFITMELDRTLSDLENLGYTCRAFIIPACAVSASHERKRVFIIAYSESQRRQRGRSNQPPEGPVCLQPEGLVEVGDWTLEARRWFQREADGVPRKLDGGGLDANAKPQEMGSAQGGAENDAASNGVRGLWKRTTPTEAPSRLRRPQQRGDSLSVVPHQSGPAGRASGDEATEKLQTVWRGVHAHSQQKAQPMQPKVPLRNGQAERHEALASWSPEPNRGRITSGVPNRVDRLRALGNAVVPAVVEEIGRMIMVADQ